MRILLTNDDGIFAEGIVTLAKILIDFGEVTVAAPNRQRSAVSHGITVHEPLVVREVDYPVAVANAYSISGKPADCVRVGVQDLSAGKPDFVISGINAGPNFGQDVFYSGTVSGAIEGMFYGIPSMAVSLDGTSFEICNVHLKEVLGWFFETKIGDKTIWNVNIPSMTLEDYKGITQASLSGHSQFPYRFTKYQSGEREWYYFPLSEAAGVLEKNSDVDFVRKGYIAITPLTINLEER